LELKRLQVALNAASKHLDEFKGERDAGFRGCQQNPTCRRSPWAGSFPPTFSNLMADPDDLGKAAAEANRRHYFLQANALEIGRRANPLSLNVEVPSMIVTGGATGRLTGIWRWRSIVRR
jgi:hypothetical protein